MTHAVTGEMFCCMGGTKANMLHACTHREAHGASFSHTRELYIYIFFFLVVKKIGDMSYMYIFIYMYMHMWLYVCVYHITSHHTIAWQDMMACVYIYMCVCGRICVCVNCYFKQHLRKQGAIPLIIGGWPMKRPCRQFLRVRRHTAGMPLKLGTQLFLAANQAYSGTKRRRLWHR